jgi:hypothetical protein
MRWTADAGASLSGEPIVIGCRLFVTAGDGTVVAFNSRKGELLWRHPSGYAVAPTFQVFAALAYDDSELLLAGLPTDPALSQLFQAMKILADGVDYHTAENYDYPPGPELEAALVPVYIPRMPTNPFTGLPVAFSGSPSPGDYRYDRPMGLSYYLAPWWTDNAMVEWMPGNDASCLSGPDPSLPASPVRGGIPLALEPVDGSEIWRHVGPDPLRTSVPSIGPSGILWTSAEESPM